MAVTYAAAGVAAGLSGTLLSDALQNPWVLGAFAALFVLLSLSMFGFYELQLPASLQSKLSDASNRMKGGTFWGVFAMGVLSALIVGPCVAAPLAGALLYINQTRDAAAGRVGSVCHGAGHGGAAAGGRAVRRHAAAAGGRLDADGQELLRRHAAGAGDLDHLSGDPAWRICCCGRRC